MIKVPPFRRGPATRFKGPNKIDFCTYEGARVLCSEIEAGWAEAGHPEIRAEPYPQKLGGAIIWGVKIHGLRNGLPIKALEATRKCER